MRLFIAVFPPKDVQKEVFKRLSIPALAKIRWGKPESFHITLKFIGRIQKENDSIFRHVLTNVCSRHQPFKINLEGGGGFPDLDRPRVLWTGVAGGLDPLKSLAVDVERECSDLGYPPENRRFSPHVTLSRVEGIDSTLRTAFLNEFSPYHSAPFLVDQIHLVESKTTPSGSIYNTLFSSPFQ